MKFHILARPDCLHCSSAVLHVDLYALLSSSYRYLSCPTFAFFAKKREREREREREKEREKERERGRQTDRQIDRDKQR